MTRGVIAALCVWMAGLAACSRTGYDARVALADAVVGDLSGGDTDLVDTGPPSDAPLGDVTASDALTDAAEEDHALPDAFVCPAVCNGGCPFGVCVVHGGTEQIDCPDQLPCLVNCIDEGSCPKSITCGSASCVVNCGGTGENFQCASSIDCSQSESCTVNCLGDCSCGARITCGVGPCTVTCGTPTTQGQCANIVDCYQSCGCDVVCDGLFSCSGWVSCPTDCSEQGPAKGCTTALAGCQTCP